MIIVKLQGGLGNQMFQYAAGLRLAMKHHTNLKLDIRFLLDRNPAYTHVLRDFDLTIFNNCYIAIATQKECQRFTDDDSLFASLYKRFIFPTRLIIENEPPKFTSDVLNSPDNTYLDGYWQSELYFNDISSTIRIYFSLKQSKNLAITELGMCIAAEDSVCINVRRGDYVNHYSSMKTHGFCGLDYYHNAVEYLKATVGDFKLYVFSDDIVWCRESLKLDAPSFLVGHEYAGEKFRDYLWLMTQCHHFIIPNSTFAWWAAWLAPYKGKIIIAPERWFADDAYEHKASEIVPINWIRVGSGINRSL